MWNDDAKVIELICQENFGSCCTVLVQPKAELLGACVLMEKKAIYLFSLENCFMQCLLHEKVV